MLGIRICLIALIFSVAQAQNAPKTIEAIRGNSPTIDGLANDSIWMEAHAAKDFVMLEPGNGDAIPPEFATEVRIAYNDEGLFVYADMRDPHPDSILTQLTPRDNIEGNNEFFGIFINPFNDGVNDFFFFITSAGVQGDGVVNADGSNDQWNSVWQSAVHLDSTGWQAELFLPWQTLRFSEDGPDEWGLNMTRLIRRHRAEYTWNFIDRNIPNYGIQNGRLTGIQDVKPPVRLTLYPYVSAVHSRLPGQAGSNFNAGLDLRYGINESFTLDMALVPDFSQASFDNQRLNLDPFENEFAENRKFFQDGSEVFKRGNLFYSRRIGGAPVNITQNSVNDSGLVLSGQQNTQLINAIKVAGRTKSNLGIGVLNALTANNYADATNPETGEEFKILVEPLTNYNVLVLDQRLSQNQSIGLVNTNTMRRGSSRDANVSAVMADLADKSNTYRAVGQFTTSLVHRGDSNTLGWNSYLSLRKQSGHWRFELTEEILSDSYDINDLGFLARNNSFNHKLYTWYTTIKPVGKFNKIKGGAEFVYNQLYAPRWFERFHIKLDGFVMLNSFFATGTFAEIRPVFHYDFFEPRTPGRYFRRPSSYWQEAFISTDYRKTFALDWSAGYWEWSNYGSHGYYTSIKPRIRFSDRFMTILEFSPGTRLNHIGWVNSLDDGTIVMGSRDFDNVTLGLELNYVFNPNMSMRVDARHQWSRVVYNQFYELNDEGDLQVIDYHQNEDLMFSAWNIDLRYSWWFAPGSQMTLLYRNSLIGLSDDVSNKYLSALGNTFGDELLHTFNLRITYFLDYNTVRKKKA